MEASAWSPTHRVPANGMQAWDAPDPARTPVANLAAGVELIVRERRGAWANVVGSNGWTGWVDGRLLVEIPVFTPTHAVPQGGMPLWAEPDPSQAPIGQLPEGTGVSVEERTGAWAKVSTALSGTGWVDGRLLQAPVSAASPFPPPTAETAPPPTDRTAVYDSLGGAPATTHPAAATAAATTAATTRPLAFRKDRSLSLIGAAIVIGSAFLPWTRGAFGSADSFDVPAMFLFDYETTSSAPDWGIVVVVLGAIGLLIALSNMGKGALRTVGIVTAAVVVLFLFQFWRYIDFLGGDMPSDVIETLSVGGPAMLAGGIMMITGR